MAKTLNRIGSKTLDAILRGSYRAKQIRLADGGGLFLKPNKTGGGYWSYRYRGLLWLLASLSRTRRSTGN